MEQPAVAKKMKFSLGPKAFQDGNKIEIQEVWSERGTLAKGDTVKVKGTYTLGSKPTATLAFYVTASSPSDAYGPGLERQVKAVAAVPFEMERPITCDGHLHLGFYDNQTGECLGTVYFGTGTQMKEIADWQKSWVDQINRPKTARATVAAHGAAKKVKFVLVPVGQPAAAGIINVVLGPSAFAKGDNIDIQEVRSERGTLAAGDTVTVKGTYTLSSHSAATLLFGLTADAQAPQNEAILQRRIQAGTVPFEMKLPIMTDGHLHLGFYPVQGGNVLGTIYFGTEAQMKEIANWNVASWIGKGKPKK